MVAFMSLTKRCCGGKGELASLLFLASAEGRLDSAIMCLILRRGKSSRFAPAFKQAELPDASAGGRSAGSCSDQTVSRCEISIQAPQMSCNERMFKAASA